VPDHILQYNAAIHVFLEKSFLNKLFRRKWLAVLKVKLCLVLQNTIP
jgi:hypothetical protein